MSIIIEALEEKREKVEEELSSAEHSVRNHDKDASEVKARYAILMDLLKSTKESLDKADKLPKTWWSASNHHSVSDLKKPLVDSFNVIYKELQETEKEIGELPRRLVSKTERVKELEEDISDINREIEKQKKREAGFVI